MGTLVLLGVYWKSHVAVTALHMYRTVASSSLPQSLEVHITERSISRSYKNCLVRFV